MYNFLMFIRNYDELKTSPIREVALKIAERGLLAIDTKNVIKENVSLEGDMIIISDRRYEIPKTGKLIVIGVGKCSILAASALEEVLGEKISSGLVLDVKENDFCRLTRIECLRGSHPFPSDANILASKKILSMLSDLKSEDLCLFVISGGGSTLLCLPEDGATCLEEKTILEELMNSGAPIEDVNIVRKHMSLARGGHLAKQAFPAQVVSLIFSDVPGNDLGTIASGPTVKDTTTIKDADRILSKYGILDKCGLEHCGLIETPKDEKYFKNVYNVLVVSNEKALNAMKEEAERSGRKALIEDTSFSGEAKDFGSFVAEAIKGAEKNRVLLYGGETTVTIKGPAGRGGRNQELAFSALESIGEDGEEVVLALASDGRDNGEYAGAVVDKNTLVKARNMNLDTRKYLETHNLTELFEKTGDLIVTGNTGANVSDLVIAIK